MNELKIDDERVEIGEGTCATGSITIRPHHANNRIRIGKYCNFANEVVIFAGGRHPMSYISQFPIKFFFNKCSYENWSDDCGDAHEETVIGHDVWIAHGATVLSGVTIGSGAAVGAGSVVTKHVPPYAVVAGNPARIIKYRFPKESIDTLLEIQWWNWPREMIEEACTLIGSSDLDALLNFYNQHINPT